MLIVIAGLPGSGKSFLAQKLAEAIGATYLNSDKIRIEMLAKGKYSDEDKLAVYTKMELYASKSLSKGKNVVVDATFYRRSFREMFEKLAERNRVSFRIIEVKADEPEIRRRLSAPRQFSEADFKVYEMIRDQYEQITTPHLVLVSTDTNIHEMLLKARKYIGYDGN